MKQTLKKREKMLEIFKKFKFSETAKICKFDENLKLFTKTSRKLKQKQKKQFSRKFKF